eukprot:ctg_341.g115
MDETVPNPFSEEKRSRLRQVDTPRRVRQKSGAPPPRQAIPYVLSGGARTGDANDPASDSVTVTRCTRPIGGCHVIALLGSESGGDGLLAQIPSGRGSAAARNGCVAAWITQSVLAHVLLKPHSAPLPIPPSQFPSVPPSALYFTLCFRAQRAGEQGALCAVLAPGGGRLVSAGRVKVNGRAAEHGMRIVPRDEILVDGKQFSLPQQLFQGADDVEQMERNFAYFKYWKPAGVTCTCDRNDPDNILDAVAGAIPSRLKSARVFNVGRLDKDSTGLVLLTDDGRLPNALLRKEFKLPKVYRVKLDREPSPEDLDKLRNGVLITTEVKYDRTVKVLRAKTRPCEVRKLNKWMVEFVLTEGRNRQIRKMLETLRYRVLSLHRVSFCGIRLSPPLHAEGQLARLNADEMQIVRGAVSQWLQRRAADGQASSPSPPPPTGVAWSDGRDGCAQPDWPRADKRGRGERRRELHAANDAPSGGRCRAAIATPGTPAALPAYVF